MYVPKFIKLIFISLGAISIALVTLLLLAYWYMSSGVFGSESFEKTKWHIAISDENSATCYRGGMAKDIRDNFLSNKMNENDIINLLGAPDRYFAKNEYQYSLGMCSGLGFDYDSLHIVVDEHGYFSQAKIIQH